MPRKKLPDGWAAMGRNTFTRRDGYKVFRPEGKVTWFVVDENEEYVLTKDNGQPKYFRSHEKAIEELEAADPSNLDWDLDQSTGDDDDAANDVQRYGERTHAFQDHSGRPQKITEGCDKASPTHTKAKTGSVVINKDGKEITVYGGSINVSDDTVKISNSDLVEIT
jgi:hypothetical protein